jgi:hypothetical protein
MPQHGTPDTQGDALDPQQDTPDATPAPPQEPQGTPAPQQDTPDATPLPPQHG